MVIGLVAASMALAPFPIVGLQVAAPSRGRVDDFCKFIGTALKDGGVNTLVISVDDSMEMHRRPEMSNPGALTIADAKKISAACKEAGIQVIPEFNCLGHQSWAANTGLLLKKHPEFDETPGKYPGNKGIYCRSYCPNAPGLHDVLFDMLDDIADAFDAKAVHCGMDEVFILADKDCSRCAGKPTADLFAQEVTRLHDHLASKGRRMWMWGDRFLDGRTNGLGEWEAATNLTHSAIDKVPKDIMICDWHYEKAEPTPVYFAMHGLDVLACPWRITKVAEGNAKLINDVRAGANAKIAGHLQGMMCTCWSGADAFMDAYNGKTKGGEANGNVATFKAMLAAAKASS